jgi:hypothetical protein
VGVGGDGRGELVFGGGHGVYFDSRGSNLDSRDNPP